MWASLQDAAAFFGFILELSYVFDFLSFDCDVLVCQAFKNVFSFLRTSVVDVDCYQH